MSYNRRHSQCQVLCWYSKTLNSRVYKGKLKKNLSDGVQLHTEVDITSRRNVCQYFNYIYMYLCLTIKQIEGSFFGKKILYKI